MEENDKEGKLPAALDYKRTDFLDAFSANINDDLWIHTTFHTMTNIVINRGTGSSLLQGARVLDFGCGDGNISRWALSQGACEVVGIDLSELQIEKAIKDTPSHLPVSYHVRDVLSMNSPDYGTFDVVIGIHIICYADTSDKLSHMIKIVASSLKKGGRFVGVRECYDSASKGMALTSMKVEIQPDTGLMFAYDMEVNEKGLAYDYCKCFNHFRSSDGSSLTLTNYLVSESTMIQMFTDTGFKINSVGPFLECSPEGRELFPSEFMKLLIDDWGKYMWYFDVTKL